MKLSAHLFGPLVVARRVLWNKVYLSGCFLGIVSLVFSKFWHDARNSYEVVRDRAGFSGKYFFAPKIGKIDQKMGQNRVFLIYWKVWSLIFTKFVLQWKLALFAVFWHKSHIWENFCSLDMGQIVLSQSDCRNF